ncbi:DUF2946 family protein [Castellaniella caeni]|uniref:DUF2946 family protein n=1 Tax=Castellaniella caeni TaxID=266123 RepID=UPI0008327826|nr:DUF2946 family protein [Castellaniella caeni]
MQHTGKRTRGRSCIHWLLILGLWLQIVGPVFARPLPLNALQGLQIVACTPAGMVTIDLADTDQDSKASGKPQTHQTGHCLLCATHPLPPSTVVADAVAPVARQAQPAPGFDETPCDARITGTWEWPPSRCPPTDCC